MANDMSDTQMDLARRNLAGFGNRIRFCPGDMTKLSFEKASQTAVMALYTLLHLPQEEQLDMMYSMFRWLKPGGCLLANFDAMETKGGVFEHWLDDKGWMYVSSYGAEVIAEKLREVGFEITKQEVVKDKTESFLWVIARKPEIG